MEYSATKNINHYAQTLTYLLGELKHVFDQQNDSEITRKAAYERLAEISQIMQFILERYPLLKTKELLISARNLVQAVKTYNYNNYSIECHSKLVDNINTLYRSFQFNISNCLMKNVSMAAVQSINPSDVDQSPNKMALQHRTQSQRTQLQPQLPTNVAEERIFACESGLDELLKQAKIWSKYMKDIIVFIEKRAQIENEYNRSIAKNAQSLKASIHHLKNDKAFLPLNVIYNQFCQNEIKNANICFDRFDILNKNILDPINEFRMEFDKQIKKIKEDWAKENKQLNDVINNYTKAREIFLMKVQENEKTKHKLSENNNEQWNNEKLEKLDRTAEADANYTKHILTVNSQKEIFKKAKRDFINRLQNLLTTSEINVQKITLHYFETLKYSIIYTPEEIQKAINDTKDYETGKAYLDFAESLPCIFRDLMHNSICANQENPEIDSSESDNNSNFQAKHPKENKSPNSVVRQQNNEFQSKTLEKKCKSCYGHYSVSSKNINDDNRKPIFGVPLCNLSSNSVPDIIKQCIKQIEMRGSHTTGIYRVSAVKSQVENLCNLYETNSNNIDLSSKSPNVIANVLKYFFRKLPEPLLTFQLYPDFIEIAMKYAKNIENEEEIIVQLSKIVHRLPLVHYNTLKYLMRHLNQIAKDHDLNQMNPSNLGIVFGPTLLKKNNDDNTALLYDNNHQNRIIELLIIYADQIFDQPSQESSFSNSLHRNNSFSSIEKSKNNQNNERQSTNGENNNNNNYRLPQLLKSATCSSIRTDQIKHEMNQARLHFFSSVNPQPDRLIYSSYSPTNDSSSKIFKSDDTTMSPFSQITAASSSNTVPNYINNGSRVKRSSIVHHLISNPNEKSNNNNNNNKIYNKHNEISKSSSDIFTYKNLNISITPNNNEDHV